VAALHRRLGHPGRAEQVLIDTLVAAQEMHGAQHPVTLDVRRELAGVLIEQSRFRDAAVPLRRRHAALSARHGPMHPALFESHLSLAHVEWQLARMPAATGAAQAAVAIARRDGDGSRMAAAMLMHARILHDAGRDIDARVMLHDARAARVAQVGAAHPQIAEIDHALGEVDAALGHPGAVARLQRAVHFLETGYGRRDPRTDAARLALAHQQAAHGDAGGRRALAAIAARAGRTFEPQPLSWRAAAYLLAMRCHGGERARSLRRLARLHAAVQRAQPDGGATEREIARVLDQCRRAHDPFMPTGTL
jgi:serine/threonine-protein kinase